MTLPTTVVESAYTPPAAPLAPVDTTPRFASVGQRVGSALVDCLVTVTLCIPIYRSEGASRTATFIWMAVVWAVWAAYVFFVYRRWGQTLGKWVFRTRLVSADGDRLTDRRILGRIAVLIVVALAVMPGYWQALGRLHAGSYADVSWLERQTLIDELTPGWGDVIIGIYWLLVAACLVTMLLSSRKQALHDMVAGTVVVSLRATKQQVDEPAHFGRWSRVLVIADWTLATLLALAAGLFFIGYLVVRLDPTVGEDQGASSTVMFYLAAIPAVLSALMVVAALNVRNPSRTVRSLTHWLAYVLTFIPIGLVLLGFALEVMDTFIPSESAVPTVVQSAWTGDPRS